MAAAAAAMHPAPTSPPPAGSVVARRARSRLAAAGSNAVTCLFVADVWLLFWGLGTWNVGRLACGVGCPVTVAAAKVFVAAAVAFLLVAPLSLIVMARTAGAAIDIEAVEAPAPNSTAAALREALRDPVVIAVFASIVFAILVLAGLLVKGDSPIKGSRRERVGSVIYDVGALGMDTVNCLIVCPILTMRTWRTWRMA